MRLVDSDAELMRPGRSGYTRDRGQARESKAELRIIRWLARTCRKVSRGLSRSDQKRHRVEELNKEGEGRGAWCRESVENGMCLDSASSRHRAGRFCTVSTALLLKLYHVYLREA